MGAWSSQLVKSNMRLAHHLLRHPSGVWHFRLTVPCDLREALGLKIIKRSLRTRDPTAARAWAYIMGQLALSDFTTVDGVPCLTITDEGEAQSVKNHASLRTIPIHPDLIGLGLMERVGALRAAGEARLFPRVKLGAVNGQGQWLGKAFTRHWQEVGLKKPAKGKIGFHSLRKTAIQTMKAAKVPLEWRCAYVGHDLDEEHIEAYSGEYGPKEMLEAVVSGLGWNLNLDGLRRLLNSVP